MSLVNTVESIARGPVGRRVERALEIVGLQSVGQNVYNYILSTIIVRNGEYTIAIGDAEATFEVTTHEGYFRLKSMFEDDILSALLEDIEAGDVFYDIGANVGVYTCLVGDILSDIDLVAFEPHPGNVRQLRENLARNGIDSEVNEKALSDEDGKVSLAVAVESHTTSPGHNLIEINESVEAYGNDSAETLSTDMVRGDQFIESQNLPVPTVLKIDVEGAEYNVLRGLQETISRSECRVIYCEVHRNHLETFGSSEKELRELLESCRFDLQALNDLGSKYHLKATKKVRESPERYPSTSDME